MTTTKNICCWWCYNFFAGVKTNTFVDFFCFVDLFLLLLFLLLLLLCLLLPGSVVLLFPFLRFRKRPAPPPPPPKMLPPIPPSCSSTTTRTRGRRWFLPRRSRTPATAFRMPWRWSPPPPPPPRRWSPPFEWKSTTTFCSAPPPPKECFETMRLPVSPMDVHVSRALCVVIKNGYKSQMSFRFPTTSSKTCFKKTRWMRRPRARKKKKAPPPFSRRSLSRALSRSLVALPFAFSGGVVGARVSNNNPRAVRRLFF